MSSRIIFNGQEYAGAEAMPGDVWRAYQKALGALADNDGDGLLEVPPSLGNDRILEALDSTERALGLALQMLGLFVAGGVIVGGLWIIANMDERSRTQGGAFYIGLAMVVALGWAGGIVVSAHRSRSQ
jgi:hypothetical protein